MEISYRRLAAGDIKADALKYFNRYQEVKKCWRRQNGEWALVDHPFIEDWDEEKKSELADEYLPSIIRDGGVVIGAFDGEKMVGFAAVQGKPIGAKKQYLQLASLQVSNEYRGKGIGKTLFGMCVCAIKKLDVPKMYISAHSSEESQAFYRAVGCVLAEELIPELYAKEPFDVHLEYIIH